QTVGGSRHTSRGVRSPSPGGVGWCCRPAQRVAVLDHGAVEVFAGCRYRSAERRGASVVLALFRSACAPIQRRRACASTSPRPPMISIMIGSGWAKRHHGSTLPAQPSSSQGGHLSTRALSPSYNIGLPTLLYSQHPCPERSHH